jgi:DSF synthase
MNAQTLVPAAPSTPNIRLEVEQERGVYWMFMHASPEQLARPCCSLPIIQDGIAIQEYVTRLHRSRQSDTTLGHLVLGSEAPVFSLGGDLTMFSQAIRSGNRDGLMQYALKCAKAVHGFHAIAEHGMQSIAMVQGDALGGGFEVALSCNTIVAEEGTVLGFPEALFGLFPGMGAYSFLRRRVSSSQARRMMLDSCLYSAADLHSMGVVDVLVKRTEGVEAVEGLIHDRRRCGPAYRTVSRLEHKYDGVPLDELNDITEEWVNTALGLGEKGVQTMERIVRAQARRFAGHDVVLPPASRTKGE